MMLSRLFLLPFLVLVSCTPHMDEVPPIHRKMFGLIEKFDRFDTDGDGYLSRRELEAGVNSMGSDRLTKDQFDRVMIVYDTNKDGKISLKEAKAAAETGPIVFEN
jgi:EF-hand domain pair